MPLRNHGSVDLIGWGKVLTPHTRLEIRNQMRSDLCEVFYLLWVRMIMVAVFVSVVAE
jgi:hypothetical protein